MLKKFLSSVFLCCCIYSITVAQNIDSLYHKFDNATNEERFRIANEISLATGGGELDDKATPEFVNDQVLKLIIFYYFDKEDFRKTVDFANGVTKQFSDSLNLSGCYNLIGSAYQRLGLFNLAIENYNRSNEILVALNSPVSKRASRYTRNNIAAIYIEMHDLDKAETMYKECLNEIEQYDTDTIIILDKATYLNNLGIIYNAQAANLTGRERIVKVREAVDAGNTSLDLSRQYGDKPQKLISRLYTLAHSYSLDGDFVKARKLLAEALELSENGNFDYMCAQTYIIYGIVEKNAGKNAESEKYFEKALKISETNDFKDLYRQSLENIYEVVRTTNPTKSLNYFEKSINIKDSIFNERQQNILSEYDVKYETEKKEHRIEIQNLQLRRHKLLLIALTLIATVCLIILLLINNFRRLQKRRAAELAKINATKDKLFSIISHDLKNPAFAQREVLKMLSENVNTIDKDSLQQCYSALLQSCDNQIELLLNLLSWAQLQTGSQKYIPIDFELSNVIHTEINLMKMTAENKKIKIDVDIPENIIIHADKTMLSIVIRNLLSNAIKFTNEGGTIRIALTNEGSDKVISISDDGVGMSEEKIKKLFTLGNRVSTVGTAGEQGSGLGLILCKEFMERNGGNITVSSIEGKGTTFKLSGSLFNR